MDKQEFLAQADVSKFINWLIIKLPNLPIELNIKKSPFNPNEINASVNGLPLVLEHYSWKASWIDQNNVTVNSVDWDSTSKSLERLSNELRLAVDNHDEQKTLLMCLAVLKWGGVKGAIRFLKNKASNNQLVDYLNNCRPYFDISNNQSLQKVDANLIERFDAGLTKIHSLLDQSGSPIYDSRVGAAIAMLYQLYKNDCVGESLLDFPSGSAKGSQIRDPGDLGFNSAPQFYTSSVKSYQWAQYQIKLGWIIEVLAQQNWFQVKTSYSLSYQCRAIEACLFMIGYDLSSINSQVTTLKNIDNGKSIPIEEVFSRCNWVPSSHIFAFTLNNFLEFKKERLHITNIEKEFKNWLITKYDYSKATVNSYCYPLREREFDLWECSIEELEILVKGGKGALDVVLLNNQLVVDERAWVCLYDAFIVGILNKQGLNPKEIEDLLIRKKIAGTRNAITTLLYVGKQVGKHFALLDDQLKPTSLFYETFGDQELEMFF